MSRLSTQSMTKKAGNTKWTVNIPLGRKAYRMLPLKVPNAEIESISTEGETDHFIRQ